MLEGYIRKKVGEKLRDYGKDSFSTHLIEALGLLGKSTPPPNPNERVDWANELIRKYRKISKLLASNYEEREEKKEMEKVQIKRLEEELERLGKF